MNTSSQKMLTPLPPAAAVKVELIETMVSSFPLKPGLSGPFMTLTAKQAGPGMHLPRQAATKRRSFTLASRRDRAART